MSVYMIVEAKEVFNTAKYGEYVRLVPALVEKFGGRYLARGGEVTVVEGDWKPQRLVIVEFGSLDQFRAWWNSPEYRKIAHLREQGAKTHAVIVQGISR